MFFKFTVKSRILTLWKSVFSKKPIKNIIAWHKLVNKKLCPICENKMHKNALNTYNCGKCFSSYCNEIGI